MVAKVDVGVPASAGWVTGATWNSVISSNTNLNAYGRDYVKREKNAVNVIGAIARRTLRIEVFQRIRMFAREKFLDRDA